MTTDYGPCPNCGHDTHWHYIPEIEDYGCDECGMDWPDDYITSTSGWRPGCFAAEVKQGRWVQAPGTPRWTWRDA